MPAADHDFEEEEAERTAPLPRASSWKAASRLLSQSETKREEEAEAGRRSAGDAWPKAAASSWNTAHDLLLQKQMTKQRDEEDDEDQEDAPSKPAASGWNTARDLLLQHQQTEAEDRPGQGRDANPFARSKPKVCSCTKQQSLLGLTDALNVVLRYHKHSYSSGKVSSNIWLHVLLCKQHMLTLPGHASEGPCMMRTVNCVLAP